MTVEHRTGNLFAQTDLAAIGHGVNLMGKMGSGIAPEFRRIWPDMYTAYVEACHTGRLTLGGVFAWQAPSGVWIYNLATQCRTGRDARLSAVGSAVNAALQHAESVGVGSIGLPRIGAGIGGLNWPEVATTIEGVAAAHPVRVVVVSLPDV